MPVSKRRKKKNRYRGGPPPPKNAVKTQKGLTKRKILIYIISAAMIISLAASFLIGTGGGHGGLQDNPGTAPQSVDGRNLLTDPDGAPVAPHNQNMGADDNVAEPATGN